MQAPLYSRKISFVAFIITLLNSKFVFAEDQNRIIERNDGYISIVVYTILSVIALFTFFSLIYIFLKQLNIEWDFQKDDDHH